MTPGFSRVHVTLFFAMTLRQSVGPSIGLLLNVFAFVERVIFINVNVARVFRNASPHTDCVTN